MKLLGQPGNKFGQMKFWWMRNQCLQDEVVDCSSHRVRAFVWDFEGEPLWELWVPSKSHTNALIQLVKFYFISKVVIKRGLKLMAGTLGSTFRKGEVGIQIPHLASSPPQVLLDEGLSLKIFIQDSWVDGGGDFIRREVFQALPEGKKNQKLGEYRSL